MSQWLPEHLCWNCSENTADPRHGLVFQMIYSHRKINLVVAGYERSTDTAVTGEVLRPRRLLRDERTY